ncbi:MAG: acyl-CoA/acyl-ACP dehydrogenase [Trueperaceae bacterium]|nr:acyl-CoA/acyl-ACP dehydrogenase [Trueperaceae bacterium]
MERAPLDLARDLAAALAPTAADADARGAMPATDVDHLRASDYLRLALPRAHGGAEVTLETQVAAHQIVAAGSAATALVAAMTAMVVGTARDSAAWAHERERVFALVAGGALVNVVASEAELGSPSGGGTPRTALTRAGDHYVLDGRKTWATGGRHLTHLFVLAQGPEGPVTVAVANHAPGVAWLATWGDGLSLRGSESHDVSFTRVRVDADQVLSLQPTAPHERPNAWFTALVAATYLGTARAARDAVIDFALDRVPSGLGAPIATLPAVRRQIGELDAALAPAEAQLSKAARAWDERRDVLPLTLAKHVAVEAALRVTEGALRVAGGAGLDRRLPLERHFRDARAGLGHPPKGDALLERLGAAAIEARSVAR